MTTHVIQAPVQNRSESGLGEQTVLVQDIVDQTHQVSAKVLKEQK